MENQQPTPTPMSMSLATEMSAPDKKEKKKTKKSSSNKKKTKKKLSSQTAVTTTHDEDISKPPKKSKSKKSSSSRSTAVINDVKNDVVSVEEEDIFKDYTSTKKDKKKQKKKKQKSSNSNNNNNNNSISKKSKKMIKKKGSEDDDESSLISIIIVDDDNIGEASLTADPFAIPSLDVERGDRSPVPKGGVVKGEAFVVSYPTTTDGGYDDYDVEMAANSSVVQNPSPASSATIPANVQVIAPATLKAGQKFEAVVDGKQFSVTVPNGGVKKNDAFFVPDPSTTTTAKNYVDAFGHVSTGRWRTALCDCCSHGNDCLCLMGFCCSSILMGQVMQRLKFNVWGRPAVYEKDYKAVCFFYTGITIGLFLLNIAIYLVSADSIIYLINFRVSWAIMFIIFFTCARVSMRRKYKIKPTCCEMDCCLEDCCAISFCTCCAAIQMVRHTHDEKKYPYRVGTETGLDDNAPVVV